ncbi:MAG: PilZ domain-containing protein [Spirochaetes bacterium]|nr:PilZ domain-containing protein [Spirochaetota bacterium]MBN2770195.1 PilZ domain-containing protein [Spirochaetota bacterium]
MSRAFDKRDTDRISTEAFFVQYKLANDDNVFTVEVLNVSAGGMCFLRDSVLYKKDEIRILFPFKSRKMLLKGVVVRVEGREVAIQFQDKQERIDTFVKIFNDEYREISEENKQHSKSKQSLFYNLNEFKNKDDLPL